MGKNITKFTCHSCGYESSKWLGRCPSCSSWNTLVEEPYERKKGLPGSTKKEAVPLNTITDQDIIRLSTGLNELNRVLGGGIVPGSVVLLGGDPGIGKSTLLLQVADYVARGGQKVIYLSGEESLKQVRLRSLRLNIHNPDIYLVNEQDIELLNDYIKEIDPVLVIIDSIQTVYSPNISSIPGSVSQLRECTARIINIAKSSDKAFFLVGHVTKDGILAGPRVLEHMVDAVIYFEGEKNYSLRLLKGAKNRFGPTDEIGLMEMSGQGLVEVVDPSYVFLGLPLPGSHGTAITASFEGSRPLLIEVQALVAASGAGYPRRMASGIDQNRLALIIAVLEKKTGYNLSNNDVYLKVTGGVFLKDPSVDLGIAAAIISSYRELPLTPDTVYIGELSLTGQIRTVPFLDLRLKEVEKMGYKRVVVSGNAFKNRAYETKLSIIEVNTLDEFIGLIMEG